MADWLPEYFFKTTKGTWRPPHEKKAAEGRFASSDAAADQRFANALIDGVPVRDQDRPGNDRTCWTGFDNVAALAFMNKAGRFRKWRAESGDLTDEEQIAVEDDYRTCVRCGSGARGQAEEGSTQNPASETLTNRVTIADTPTKVLRPTDG